MLYKFHKQTRYFNLHNYFFSFLFVNQSKIIINNNIVSCLFDHKFGFNITFDHFDLLF